MQKLFLSLFILTALHTVAQDNDLGKRTTIIFVNSETIANENFHRDSLLSWVKTVQSSMGEIMKTEKSNSNVKFIANWARNEKCLYKLSICPRNDALLDKVNEALKRTESPTAKIAAFQLLFVFVFNDGCNQSNAYYPEVLTSTEKLNHSLNAPSIAQRKEALRNWALNDVIPVLDHYTSSVNDQFVGVRYTGEILSGKRFMDKKTKLVTDSNHLYWRGVMEMSKGNLLIPVSKLFMHVANDEFDLARRYIGMLYRFADKDGLASLYLKDLNDNLNQFYKLHDSLVHIGIGFHDAGRYDKAIEIYTAILKDYPQSAWARYELYLSTKSKDANVATDLWNQQKAVVYNADPLYPLGGGANNAKDGYILFRHLRVKELFRDNKKLKEDMIEYADIAMDLEAYAFAGHLYWYLVSAFPEEKYKGHGFLTYYLYSLQKLGVTQVQSFFKEDYKKEFTAIETERLAAMKNDPMYKSFKEE